MAMPMAPSGSGKSQGVVMSTKLTSWVWDGCASAGLKLSEVTIMARLADFSNDHGISWPSVETIARQIGAGSSTVRTAIAKLEKQGWLTRRQRRYGNRNASNLYQLNLEKLFTAAAPQQMAFEHSESDASKFAASKSRENTSFDPSRSDGDPSVRSITDPSDINTFGQPATAQSLDVIRPKEQAMTAPAVIVLEHLNKLTGARYTQAKSTLQNISARFTEGNTVDELKLVVDYLVTRWLGTEWAKFLNPETMFRTSKFSGNLLAAQAWHNEGRKFRSPITSASDCSEREDAFKRYLRLAAPGENGPKTDFERLVRKEADSAGVKTMRDSFGKTAWNKIWVMHSQRSRGETDA
jgi:uncharacterized phage protein (TIGR02220 family)